MTTKKVLENRSKPCDHCDSSGKSDDTFDGLCYHCTSTHCVVCGAVNGELREVHAGGGSYHLCRQHFGEESQR